ncbi:DUF2586 family protein [Bacteroides neonati]|uniref:DUF2586 family protein n=1 Tax=Bacteroides neonati TaxID=1347393 RepID=UPI0004B35230|nr:DUF2586 family protein [Bacteroides neonati]
MNNRIIIGKGKVGKSVLGGVEKTSALVGYFGNLSSFGEGEFILLSAVTDMAAFGINETTSGLLHHHITEYFRMGGKGARLYVLNVEKGEAAGLAALVSHASVKRMIAATDGQIFNLGFSYVPQTVTKVDGLPDEIIPAVKAAQVLADWAQQTNRPLHVALEGAGLGTVTAATMANLRELKTDSTAVNCPQVSVMIGQDWDYAETRTGAEQKYADVGALLGVMAAQPVSYNIGEVATMMLTDANRGSWVNAGLSSHEKVREKETELNGLNSKGYIFGEYYSGAVCLNDDHVCARIVVDKDGNISESTIAMSRTNCKVMRELYAAYLPKIKSTVPLDAKTGKLGTGMVKYLEDIGNNVFANMTAKQEVSGGETQVDGDSNLMVGDRVLKVYFRWVPMGCIGVIEGTVNIKTSI